MGEGFTAFEGIGGGREGREEGGGEGSCFLISSLLCAIITVLVLCFESAGTRIVELESGCARRIEEGFPHERGKAPTYLMLCPSFALS